MLSDRMQTVLNNQIRIEAESSQIYLAMASWAELKGLEGVSQFMYGQSDEERQHMLKLFKYINERGGHAKVSELDGPALEFGSIKEMFETLFKHEIFVSQSINELVHISLEEKDYATHNFLQWYVDEQREEEALMRTIIDRIKLIGDGPQSLYYIDKEVRTINTAAENEAAQEAG